MKFEEDRFTVCLPVRMSPTIYKLLEHSAWAEHKSNAELTREAIIKLLQDRGVKIPEPMTIWKRMDMGMDLSRRAKLTTTTTTTAIFMTNTTSAIQTTVVEVANVAGRSF
jgi:hypothetical protein